MSLSEWRALRPDASPGEEPARPAIVLTGRPSQEAKSAALYRMRHREPGFARRAVYGSLRQSRLPLFLPAISCFGVPGACGAIWGNLFATVFKELPPDHPLRHRDREPAPPEEFYALAADVREALDLPPGVRLEPGTRLGHLHMKRIKRQIYPFERVSMDVVVTEEVRDLLQRAGLTGWRVEPVVVEPGPYSASCPPLYEFLVEGCGTMHVEPPPVVVSDCRVCGRRVLAWPPPERLEFCEAEADFQRFSPPFHHIFISERAKEVLESSGLFDWELTPLETAVSERMVELREGWNRYLLARSMTERTTQ